MSNSFAQLFDEQLWGVSESTSPPLIPDGFDEDAYLKANPDVAAAIKSGEFRSGYDHYAAEGWQEKRRLFPPGAEPRGRFMRTLAPSVVASAAGELRANVDAMLVSTCGGIMLVGWLDDAAAPLDFVQVTAPGWYYTFDAANIVRFRRRDVEDALGSSRTHSFGFLAFAFPDQPESLQGNCDLLLGIRNGAQTSVVITPRRVDDVELRNVVLRYIAEAEFFGNRQIEAMRLLEGSLGREIIRHNLHITRTVVSGACVERFGQPARTPRGSIIVCLYGKPEYLFLQNALFAGCPGFEDYELIYVSNSPELAERLVKEAKAAQQIYGLPQTLVLLPGNAGFGAANNIAASHASSSRILIVNPDVFPRDAEWARKHTQAITDLPADQTRLFGVPLYYDDGTLMHGGMYFEFDTGISLDNNQVAQRQILRVEHYGKGAPAWASHFTQSRPIQGVTGAFMSVDREWFETLGGFTENYVFGHYEDADLCLKSLQRGIAPWLHDIRLWHLEGKGSLRLPVHEGGSLVNRWLFTDAWAELVSQGLYGQTPTSKLLRPARRAEPAEPAPPADAQVVSRAPAGREARAAARTHQQRRAARKAASS